MKRVNHPFPAYRGYPDDFFSDTAPGTLEPWPSLAHWVLCPFRTCLAQLGEPKGNRPGNEAEKKLMIPIINLWLSILIYIFIYIYIGIYTYIYMYLYRCIYICIYIYTYIYILIYLSLCWSRYQSALIYINLYQSHSLDIRPRPNEANKFFGHELIGTILHESPCSAYCFWVVPSGKHTKNWWENHHVLWENQLENSHFQ